jgi:prepilin peptidase CpaA
MNLTVMSPDWLYWIFAGLLVAAAVEDSIRLRISNLTCLGVLVGALTAMGLAGIDWALWQNFALFAGLLMLGTAIFAAGKMGGGDIKLIAAAALWFDLRTGFLALLWIVLAGGLLAITVIIVRKFGWSDAARERVLLLKRRGGIPYGVAIAAGVLLASAAVRL